MRMIAGALVALVIVLDAPARGQVPNNLKCYRMKDQQKRVWTADLDTPDLGADPGCIIKGAKLFCVPAAATNRSTNEPPLSHPQPGDRICYQAKCPNLPADQTVSDQFGTRTASKLKTSLLCTPAFRGNAYVVDNGDGTVTDNTTGLQWEKKDADDGIEDLSNPHDVDNGYTWSSSGSAKDGTAFTDFLSRLNDCATNSSVPIVLTGGFAGHCDWRLPTWAEAVAVGRDGAASDPAFGPHGLYNQYWSSTTVNTDSSKAWRGVGGGGEAVKTFPLYVRAVRGGS